MRGIDLGEMLDRREDVGQTAVGIGHRLAVRRDDARGVGAGGLDRHLLARAPPAGPVRARRRCAESVAPAPWRPARSNRGSAPSASTTASGSASRSSRRRQRAIAVERSRKSSSTSLHRTWSGCGVRLTIPLPAGVATCVGTRRRAPPRRRAPRWRRGGRTAPRRRTACAPEAAATACPQRRLRRGRTGIRPPRNAVGVRSHTARTVSLNCRMLEKPAANATSPNGRSVVSISTRAVCVRWARASASGFAPTSACSSRSSWRVV